MFYSVHIYSMKTTEFAEQPGDLAGDFGGMFGLLLGGSILSMVEIVDLILYNGVVKMTAIKRVNPRPHKINVRSTTPV